MQNNFVSKQKSDRNSYIKMIRVAYKFPLFFT